MALSAPPATPLERAPDELAPGHDVFLKREDVHELGAFKWRGALPVVEGYRRAGHTALVTASTGNHGAAASWAARRCGLRAIVFAPTGASTSKLALIERQGADIRLGGADLDEAKASALSFARTRDLPFFEDGAEPAQYRAYGGVAEEILEQMPEQPAAVVVPVGNGALLGGMAAVLGSRAPGTGRIGVVAKEAPVMAASWQAGHPVSATRCDTFADGLAVRVAIPLAVERLDRSADRMLLVSEREIARAVGAFHRCGIRVEGAAAAALAAVAQLLDVDNPIVLVVTGRNIDDALHDRAVRRPESFPD